jgi:putative DNA primase/helicase
MSHELTVFVFKPKRPVAYTYIDKVRRASMGRWPEVLQRVGVPEALRSGESVPCPGCGGSFRFNSLRKRGVFVCKARGRADIQGDGFSLFQHLCGFGFGATVKLVGDALRLREFRGNRKSQRGWNDLDSA